VYYPIVASHGESLVGSISYGPARIQSFVLVYSTEDPFAVLDSLKYGLTPTQIVYLIGPLSKMKHLSLRGAEMLCKLNDNRLHQGRCRV
jgi:hypothetical protein